MAQRYTFSTITGVAIADMPRKWIATIVLSAWCGTALSAEPALPEIGRQLFEQSACNACHTPAVEDRLAFAGVDFERPPRARILTKLRALAAILQDREARFGEATYAGSCPATYREFAAEYQRVHQLVFNGNPVYPMPAWQQRSGVEPAAAAAQADVDIDAVLAYLLVAEGLSLTPEQIVRWRSGLPACAGNAVVSPVTVNTTDAARREVIRARLEQLDLQQHAFDHLPVASFLSYQNYLMNQVGYLEDGELDIWILRQAQRRLDYAEVDDIMRHGKFPNLLLYAIVVDKRAPAYRAYYFQKPGGKTRWIFKRPQQPPLLEAVRNTNGFVDSDLHDCFGCHASGVLRLRPRQWGSFPDLDATQWQQIRAFNSRVVSYGPVSVDWPAAQKPLTAHDLEPVPAASCQECHRDDSVRAPVRRYQSKVIIALMNAHEDKRGYHEYGWPSPDPARLPRNLETTVLSVSQRTLPAMPPLGSMTDVENAALSEWLGRKP